VNIARMFCFCAVFFCMLPFKVCFIWAPIMMYTRMLTVVCGTLSARITAEGSSIDTIRGKSLVKPEDARKAQMTDEDGDMYMPPVLMMPTSTRNTVGKETSCRTWHKLEAAARANQTVRSNG
jgi:hypothetical protein